MVLCIEETRASTTVKECIALPCKVLPGHEIHIDPALLFFILKVSIFIIGRQLVHAAHKAGW